MYLCSVEQPDVKIAAAPPSEDKAFLPSVLHLIEQSEALHQVRRLVPLPYASLWDTKLMDLPVVAADLLLEEHFFRGSDVRMAADAPRVDAVPLLQSVPDPGPLCNIPVGHMDHIRPVFFLQAVVHLPPHDSHERGVVIPVSPFYVLRELYRPPVVSLVARPAQRDQIVRRVPAGLPALDVMDFEHAVLRLPLTAAAGMPVTEQDVFADVPAVELFSLLVVRPCRKG